VGTDFRSGDHPRSGFAEIADFVWLARLFDKARAASAGTLHDYEYPCPIDRGVFDRWGITARLFDAALDRCADDAEIAAWLCARVDDGRRTVANRWLLEEKRASLERLDAEERVVPA
jgi:hypothetical protein